MSDPIRFHEPGERFECCSRSESGHRFEKIARSSSSRRV